MPWSMTNTEKREEKRLNQTFKLKYGKSTKRKHETSFSKPRLRKWRKAVLKRDDYTCQYCGLRESLHAHHKEWQTDRPGLRYKVENGITLCENCHDREHDGLISYYKQQAFLRRIVNE